MKLIFLILIGVHLVVSEPFRKPGDSEIRNQWHSFKKTHTLKFHGEREDRHRFSIFKENYLKVLEHNHKSLDETGYTIGINELSYLTHEEFVHSRLMPWKTLENDTTTHQDNTFQYNDPLHISEEQQAVGADSLPSHVNWMTNHYTPVKNQYSCGSCWSFACIGVVEMLYKIKTNLTRQFSEQHLVDCTLRKYNSATRRSNLGCSGGWPDTGFDYIKNNGVVESKHYPYTAREGTCQTPSASKVTISGYKNIPFGDEKTLQRAVAKIGPVAVGIDAGQPGFQQYRSGIYRSNTCKTVANHAVIVVGYGTDSATGRDYWIIKNSWGHNWGDRGYVKLARNQMNMCGIASLATYAY